MNRGVEALDTVAAAVGKVESKQYLSEVKAKFIEFSSHTGVDEGLLSLKELSSDSRARWVLRNGATDTAQLSYLGRALPEGTIRQAHAALLEHSADMSVAFEVENCILERAKSFAMRWARRFCDPSNRIAPSDLPGNSGCTERTVRGGGLRAVLLERGLHPEAANLWYEQSIHDQLPVQDIQDLVTTLSTLRHGLDMRRDDGGKPPKSVAIALLERGLKVRVITKSPAYMHFLGHTVRKRILRGLKRDPRSMSTLIGVSDSELFKHFIGCKGDVCVSTDLTRASDRLPTSLVSALIDGLALSGRFLDLEIEILRLLCGPQEITYPDLDGKSILTQRGILMGLPTTWSMLSLCHLFWWDSALAASASFLGILQRDIRASDRFSICGDDSIFVGHEVTAKFYEDFIIRSGGSFSVGKHFVCEKAGTRNLRGVFIERLYEFHLDKKGLIVHAERCEAFPVRGFVGSSESPECLRDLPSNVPISYPVKLLFTVDGLLRQNGGCKVRLRDFLNSRFPWLYKFAKEMGLVNGLELNLGGSGLPINHDDSHVVLTERARALLAKRSGANFVSLLRGEVSSLWSFSTMMAKQDVEDFLADGTFQEVPVGFPPPQPQLEGPDLVKSMNKEELIETAATVVYRLNFLTMGDSVSKGGLRASALRQAVKAWKEQLPQLPAGKTAVEVIDELQQTETIIWIRRTYHPNSGDYLFPPWANEAKARQAQIAAKLLSASVLS